MSLHLFDKEKLMPENLFSWIANKINAQLNDTKRRRIEKTLEENPTNVEIALEGVVGSYITLYATHHRIPEPEVDKTACARLVMPHLKIAIAQ